MRFLFVCISMAMAVMVRAQYDHQIEFTNGNVVTHSVADIDSISFHVSDTPVFHLHLSGGSEENFALEMIEEVTFSGIPAAPFYPQGTVHCIPDSTVIEEVVNPLTGRTWMDRNLGASQVATSLADEDAYGDLYQWGRFSDGHQCRTSDVTSTLSTTPIPAHGQFISTGYNSPFDWLSPQDNNLWQGAGGLNNPCPEGYRLPTQAEWDSERSGWSSNNANGAFASPLKLTAGGFRSNVIGGISIGGFAGCYWSSTVQSINAILISFSPDATETYGSFRAEGNSIRCIKNW